MVKKLIYVLLDGEIMKERAFNLDGYPDGELTKTGLKQAQLTGKYLSKVRFNAIYSSDLKRAVQTAEIISSYQQEINSV